MRTTDSQIYSSSARYPLETLSNDQPSDCSTVRMPRLLPNTECYLIERVSQRRSDRSTSGRALWHHHFFRLRFFALHLVKKKENNAHQAHLRKQQL